MVAPSKRFDDLPIQGAEQDVIEGVVEPIVSTTNRLLMRAVDGSGSEVNGHGNIAPEHPKSSHWQP